MGYIVTGLIIFVPALIFMPILEKWLIDSE